MRTIFIVILMSFSIIARADVSSNLDDFFGKLGYGSNTSGPVAYQGQAAGYYDGGSLFLRNQVKDYQLVSVNLPSFSGGCSGIDSFLGSFSVISASQLTNMMKNIMSAGGAYAFDLALTTTVPQIKSVKDYLQKFLNDINSANINSCNTAEDLVGGVWPKTQASQQQICRDVGTSNNKFSDWAAARQGCGTGGDFNKTIDNSGSRESEVIVNKNIVWDALQKNSFTSSDIEVAEMLMSISGSIIITADNKQSHKTTLMSMAHSQGIVKALLYGGQANIYKCDEVKQCLKPTISAINVSTSDSLVSRVRNMIQKLNVAVSSDASGVDNATRGFLEMTPFPVLKYITNSLSLGKAVNPAEFSNLIALSLLNQYLSQNITIVQEALTQEDTPMTPQMSNQINQAQQLIAQKIKEGYSKLSNLNALVNNMRSDEKQLSSRVASRANVGQEN